MIVRQAIFIGAVAPDRQDAFDAHVAAQVLPLLRSLPGVASAAVLRTRDRDAGAPEIYQIYQLRFADMAAMETMLASEARLQVHEAMAAVLPWFDGQIVHLVSEAS